MRFKQSKVRAYEIARHLELSWPEFEAAAQEAGHKLASPLNTLEASDAEELVDALETQEVEPLPPTTLRERRTITHKRFHKRPRRPRRDLRKTQVHVNKPHVPVRRQTMQQCRYRR